ncbi:MAG: hypothetical protein LBD91_05375, partial [Prevotellaceae bacterium]|nr:hypothetical protein [Prevotellaceae bacterium]
KKPAIIRPLKIENNKIRKMRAKGRRTIEVLRDKEKREWRTGFGLNKKFNQKNRYRRQRYDFF